MHGFTLIELIVTVVIMAVVAGFAVPSFQGFIANQRVRNTAFDLVASLMLARSEAVARNGDVSLSPGPTGAGANWSSGWAVMSGANVLQSQEAPRNLSITDSANLSTITYGKDGRTSTAQTIFTIAPPSTVSGVSPRCISVGPTGVPSSRVAAGASC
jgi:type IV fimbrial biogenesis protein FimT